MLSAVRLYLVVTPQRCRLDVETVVKEALSGGVDLVQLRDKEAPDSDFAELARRLVPICREFGVPLILNDRAALVEETGADGVHVGKNDMTPEEVRERLGEKVLLGVSTHDRAEVAAAAARGADYLGLGPMFPTRTKSLSRAPRGVELIRETAGATDLPVFPIGGITAATLPHLVAAGATRAAVSSAICASPDPHRAARELLGHLTITPQGSR